MSGECYPGLTGREIFGLCAPAAQEPPVEFDDPDYGMRRVERIRDAARATAASARSLQAFGYGMHCRRVALAADRLIEELRELAGHTRSGARQ